MEEASEWLDKKYNKYKGTFRPLGFMLQMLVQIYFESKGQRCKKDRAYQKKIGSFIIQINLDEEMAEWLNAFVC